MINENPPQLATTHSIATTRRIKIQDQLLMKTYPNQPPLTPEPTPNVPPLNR